MSAIEQAYSKWCEQQFPRPSEQDILDLEHRINARFSDHYRDYLLDWNGGMFRWPTIFHPTESHSVGEVLYLNGIHASVDFAELGRALDLSLFEDNDPPIVLPIGTTTANDLIMLSMVIGDEADGMVILRTIDQENIHLGDTMDEFFALLRDREV